MSQDAGQTSSASPGNVSGGGSAASGSNPPGLRSLAELESERQSRDTRIGSGSTATWGLLITIALLATAWFNTFTEMWARWFPAWSRGSGLSLMQRLTEGDSYYTHGPLIPLVSLAMAWFIHKRVGMPAARSRSSALCGAALFLVALLFHLMSSYARVTFVSGFSFIGVLMGLMLLWGGWPMVRAYWLPVAFLFFMVPLPMDWIAKLNYQLKFLAGDASVWITNHVFGVTAIIDGSFVLLEPGPDGEPKSLVIENVCSGLRSLISLVSFASLFALVCRVKGLWRVVMLALSVPVALACNIARITFLNLIAHYFSVKAAGPDSALHGLSGLVVFALALAFLFGVEQAILWLGRRLHRDWADARLLGYLEAIRPPATGWQRPATLNALSLASLTIAAGLCVWWATQPVGQNIGTTAAGAVPKTIQIGERTFVGEDLALDRLSLIILETDDYLFRRFRDQSGNQGFDLLIVFSANNRKGTHPPEVCLEGGGEQIVNKRVESISALAKGPVDLRGLTTQRNSIRTEYLYVYKCGDSYTNSFVIQQLRIFMNGLVSRNTAGALIRWSTPGDERHGNAREFLHGAAAALIPEIDRGLP